MKVGLFEYVCGNCGDKFDAPSVADMAYGQFVLWSGRGMPAYLDAINDFTYQEVADALKHEPGLASYRPVERAILLRRVYGSVACDWDNGDSPPSPFEIDAYPRCPNCRSCKPRSWEVKQPATSVEVPLVTHVEWNKSTKLAKAARLKAQITQR
jgi:hypothetical protein